MYNGYISIKMSGQKKIVIKHLILFEKCNTGVGSKSPQNSVLMYLNSPYSVTQESAYVTYRGGEN